MRTMEMLEDAPPHEAALWEVLAYAAKTLPPRRATEVAAHLEGCAFCRERLTGIPEIDYWLLLEQDLPVPSPGERRLRAALHRRARRRWYLDRLRARARAPLNGPIPRCPVHTRGAVVRAIYGGMVGVLTVLALLYVPRRRPRR